MSRKKDKKNFVYLYLLDVQFIYFLSNKIFHIYSYYKITLNLTQLHKTGSEMS